MVFYSCMFALGFGVMCDTAIELIPLFFWSFQSSWEATYMHSQPQIDHN